ncbi:MAG: hypothetical protein LWW97_08685 [Deltaproteobacteria bacterium]|nr:hypothetical protein [Deltaproteobacteria bacterium]
MKLSGIISEANDAANKYNLQLVETDSTDNIISLKLLIDNDLFIQVYGNTQKDKLALVFKRRRLYGYDSQGGKYHCHPLDAPDEHLFVDDRKSIRDFVCESMEFLESRDIL